MNWLDIVLIIILIAAAVSGYRKGLISQAFGIGGLLLGILLGYRFSRRLAIWFDMNEGAANLLGFVVILVAVIVVMYIVGAVVRKVFRMTGFGILDHLGGLALGVIKIGLITSLLLGLFVNFNNRVEVIPQRVFMESLLYSPLRSAGNAVFPWILDRTADLFDGQDENVHESKPRSIPRQNI